MNYDLVQEKVSAKISILRPLFFLFFVVTMIALVNYFQLQQYLEKDRLQRFVAGYGIWAPLVYVCIWALGPIFFVPATPILVVGGILFGPFWGEVYVILGATLGAMGAFLVARYLARDWVAGKLAGTRLIALDKLVARQGWKIVAFVRLMPIFPYVLVNYAFGLTSISILSFTLATFFGMIPLTTIYVYFSANLFDLLRGKLSWQVILGILLVTVVAITPLVYKKFKAKPGERVLKF